MNIIFMPTLLWNFGRAAVARLVGQQETANQTPIKETLMIKPNLSLKTAFIAALLVGVPSVHAEKGNDHSKHAHPASDTTQGGVVMSSHDGITMLYQHLGEMEKELAAGSLEGIHGHDENIRAAVKDLDKDTTLTVEKKKRVQGYVKNVLKLSGKLHVSADGKKLDQARKDFVKLQAQVDLLDKQFAHSHKPRAADKPKTEGAHHHEDK